MVSVIIIPTRMKSSRMPNKPMAKIKGIPMIGRCYFKSIESIGKKYTFVATCDKEISNYVNSIGGNVIMTSKKHSRATTRIAEALIKIEKKLNKKVKNILMYQGDEPLIKKNSILKVFKALDNKNNYAEVINLCRRVKDKKNLNDINNVKVLVNKKNEAIYYSRILLPSSIIINQKITSGLIQTGIIGFKRKALILFNRLKETELEKYESVDMNRLIENDFKIKVISFGYESISVDTNSDLARAKIIMNNFKD